MQPGEEQAWGSLTATRRLQEPPMARKSPGADVGIQRGKNSFNKNTWDMHGSRVRARHSVHSPEVQIQGNSSFQSSTKPACPFQEEGKWHLD